jgi:cation diffusion facilitator CzcD-associated flavoprotein CzcO
MEHVHGVHELPGAELPVAGPDERASTAVGAYFAGYEERYDLRVRRPVRVTAVRDLGGPDRLVAVETVETLGAAGSAPAALGRTWRTRAVVNATGTWTSPFWPAYPGRESFAGRQLHAHDFRTADAFADRRVIVVGGGTSGVQLLLQIAPVAAATTWVTRRPPLWQEAEGLTPEAGRAAVAQVDERTRAGLPPLSVVAVTGLPLTPVNRAGIAAGVLVARPMFERIVPDGAVWAPGAVPVGDEHVLADVILWCTGYRAALGHLRSLHLRAPGGGIVMAGTEVVADPRLQLVGYGPSASTIGANRAGREAVRNLRRVVGL